MKTLSNDFKNVSLSHGTMRPEDLIPAFHNFLIENNFKSVRGASLLSQCDDSYTEKQLDYAVFVLDDLFNRLNDIAPDNCFFGSHPGDGCNYGYWEVIDW